MYTDHNHFILDRSRLAVALPIIFFIIIMVSSFMAVSISFFVVLLIFQFIILFIFLKKQKNFSLYYLDKNEWTLCIQNQNKTQRIQFSKLINHHLYIVIYLNEKNHSPLIIWCDQLSKQQWKKLLILAKMF
ncbi:hypothetical protein B9T31_00050 [Acinetobacter sp. ANC 4558]|nr:hypothetical protein B9T31_00050 [Acinetobacter sp. ANC 4558]